MAAPTFQAAGAEVQGTGALTVNWPTHEVGDVALLFVESAHQAVSLTTANGFVAVTNQGVGTAGNAAATQLSVFWCRATSTSQASPVVADSGVRQTAFILTYRGCISSGNPWDAFTGDTDAGSTSVVIPGPTTTVVNTLLVAAVSNAAGVDDPMVRPSIVNGALTNLTKRFSTQPDGVGGGTLPLPIGVFDAGAVIGKGPGNDTSGADWSCIQYAPQTATSISNDIDTADADNVLLIALLAGNKAGYRDAQGNYSPALYINKLDRWVQPQVSSTVAAKITDALNRRRMVVYVVDEPYLNNEFTPTQVNDMGREIKTRWPNALTIVRATPTLMQGWGGFPLPVNGYDKIDYMWAQYTNTHAKKGWTYPQLVANERAVIASRNFDVGLFGGHNIWAGGLFVNAIDGVASCWDYNNNGSSSGVLIGDRDAGTPNPKVCGDPTIAQLTSTLASPAWILKCAQRAAEDPDIPAYAMWQHTTGNTSSEYDFLYLRSDYVAAFDAAIAAGAARTSWNGWRTPK